jgi:mannose-6-phosphate isomerase-like protein (cupin superfamily)
MLPVPETLLPYIQSLADDPDFWQPYIRFDHVARHWSRLPSRGDVDVWLLTWLPDQRTELHDHGDSAAALTVVQGRLTEVRAHRSGTLADVDVGVGDASWVAPGVVHDVVNRSSQPAVSIHAYAPRLTRMTFWQVGRGTLLPARTVLTDQPEAAA